VACLGLQAMLGLADVGAALQHVGRQAGGQLRQRRHGLHRFGQPLGAQRCADQQRERVFVLRHQAGEARDITACGIDRGLRAPQVELRRRAEFEAVADQRVRRVLAVEGAARHLQPLAVGGQREVRVRHLGDQADVHAASRFGGGEVRLQRLLVQVAHAAEEVELVARQADAGFVLMCRRGSPALRERGWRALRGRRRRGFHGREAIGTLDLVDRPRLLDLQRGHTQVAVVGERGGDRVAQPRIDEELGPRQLGGATAAGIHRWGRCGRWPRCGHRRGRPLVLGREVGAGREQRGGEHGGEFQESVHAGCASAMMSSSREGSRAACRSFAINE
jgi:hypothetical protein